MLFELNAGPCNGYPEAIVVLHCFGRQLKETGIVDWVSARFYYKCEKDELSKGFRRGINGDVVEIFKNMYEFTTEEGLMIHTEHYSIEKDFSMLMPFSVGEWSV